MTVRELIEELEELPMDYPVVTDYREITDINLTDSFYFLDGKMDKGYSIGPAVVLE